MIVKYLSDNIWGFIDHIRQTAVREFDGAELVNRYDVEVTEKERADIASFVDGHRLNKDIAMSNKLFLMIGEELKDTIEDVDAHSVNLIMINENTSELMPLYAILLYIEDCKDYDAMVLITNQKCYLMNDEGKTIERLS